MHGAPHPLGLLRLGSLEQRIAAGDDVASDPALARRAAQLTGPRIRAATAGGLERVLRDARDPARRVFSSVAPVCRAEVLAAEADLGAVVGRLRDDHPIAAVGVARIRLALADSCSPLYVGGSPGVVGDWARAVRRELDA